MEKLKNEVIKENQKQLKKAIGNVRKAKKDDILTSWYYKEKLTNKQIEKLNNKKITIAEVKETIKNKIIKEYNKRLEKDIEKLETIKNTNNDINYISISIEWVKNPTWGYNPHVVVLTGNGEATTGTASGCGYDKESAAIAEALNKNNDILKLLYSAKNKKMTLKNTNSHDILGYGSGYGVLPYFEGGVGVSNLMYIFEKLNYKIIEKHTNKNDYYIISK